MIKPQHITKEPHHIMIKPHHMMTKAEIIMKNLQNIMPKLHHVTEYGRYNMTGPHHIMTKRQNVMINDHIRQLWLSILFIQFSFFQILPKYINGTFPLLSLYSRFFLGLLGNSNALRQH